MPDPQQAVIGGIEGHTDFGVAAALDPLGRVLGTESFPATCAGYRLTHTWLASFGPITSGRCRVHRILRCGSDPVADRSGLRGDRGQPAAPASALASRQERHHRRRGRCPQGALGRSDRSRHRHHRHRRGDPPAQRDPKQRRQGPCRRVAQIGDLLVTAPAALREQLDTRRTLEGTAASPKAKPKKKPSAASNASSPESSTAHSEPTSPPSQPALDIYRNVPERFEVPAYGVCGESVSTQQAGAAVWLRALGCPRRRSGGFSGATS